MHKFLKIGLVACASFIGSFPAHAEYNGYYERKVCGPYECVYYVNSGTAENPFWTIVYVERPDKGKYEY